MSSSSALSDKNTVEKQLTVVLDNTFSNGWLDKCSSLHRIAEIATSKENSKTSPDYLLGYVEGSAADRVGYFLQNIYSNQSELEEPLITREVKQSLNTFASAESDYLQQLQYRLKTDRKIPQEKAFQNNTKQLAELIVPLSIQASDLKKEAETKAFQQNLQTATQLMKTAFPESKSTGAFAPSDNIIILPG
ncbi:hypothetical protein [Clostridium merdae]|uniref:hypothetical protein n=1 Tax=Clostridium merdae TaxID=1958780 RepID=UPI00117E9AFD|nr:hypothetical protein [Clostridium merdae]